MKIHVTVGEGSDGRSWVCDADVAAGTSGAEFDRLLRDHVTRAGVPVDPTWRWWTSQGDDLASIRRIDADLAEGDGLRLSSRPPTWPPVLMLECAASIESRVYLAPGIHSIGGADSDDVTVPGLRPSAAVAEVDPTGRARLRYHDEVDPGDGDEMFGSPSAGRSVRLPLEREGDTAVFRIDGVRFGATLTSPVRGHDADAINRTPYRPVREGRRDLPPLMAPPAPPRPSRVAITTFVVPLASGIGIAAVLGRPQFLLIALIAPLALGVVSLAQRRSGRRSFAAERSRFRQAIAAKRMDAVDSARQAYLDAHRSSPTARRCTRVILDRETALWQRAAGGPHLLRVRIGTAHLPPTVHVPVRSGGDADLAAEAADALARACEPPGPVPVDVDLDSAGAVAVCGPPSTAFGLLRAIIVQLAAHHGPEDVVVAAALSPVALGRMRGLDWLPHVGSESSPIRLPGVATWADDIERQMAAVVEVAVARTVGGGAVRTTTPRLLLVIDEAAAVDRGALGRLLDLAPDAGIRVCWVGADSELVPRQCEVVVTTGPDGSATISSTDPDVDPRTCDFEPLDLDEFEAAARSLAPCFDVASPSRAGIVPHRLTLADLDVSTAADDVDESWGSSDGSSLAAPIGLSGRGRLELDLVRDGPHALVAGTTGSGKSELLQTWVASMAAHHPPERCTFLFVDFKGGATAAPLADLPHVVGSVTNLDAGLANRALISLRAELDRRMELMSGVAANLAEFAAVAPEACPPRLVIVIDEFATLVKEIPDFLSGVVDVAQRGRSLGIHLVLATQRPAGAVNDDILANTTIRIALRVVDAADSRSIIGTDDAAALPPSLPGRCFVRLGPNGILGAQIARSATPRRNAEGDVVRRGALTPPPGPNVRTDAETQLEAIVAQAARVHRDRGGTPPHRPWVPPLPAVIDLVDVGVAPDPDPGRVVTLGILDDPARQRRTAAVVDLEATGGLVVFGGGGSGRSTALRTACASAVANAAPAEVQFVVFDFASRALLGFGDVPHTRAVVVGDDVEGACREIEDLAHELDRRRELLGVSGVDGWAGLDTAEGPPRLLVVVDGLGALRSALDTASGHAWWEMLVRVLVEGRGVGMHALVSADRRNDLSAGLLGGLGARLVLRMAESESMVTLGVPRAAVRGVELADGRGFLGCDEVQVAVLDAAAGPTKASESRAMTTLAGTYPPVVRTPGLPSVLQRWPTAPVLCDADAAPVGVDERGAIVSIALDEPVAVVGPYGSGRSNVLGLICRYLMERGGPGERMDLAVIAGVTSPLVGLADAGVDVATDPDQGVRMLEDATRRSPGSVLVVDDAERTATGPVGAALERWIDDRRPVVVAVERSAATRSLTGVVGRIRRLRSMVVLQPDSAAEVEALAGRRIRFRPGTAFPAGRAVVLRPGATVVAQLKQYETD